MGEGLFRAGYCLLALMVLPTGAQAAWESIGIPGDRSNCRLQTEVRTVFDGYGETDVQLHLDSQRLRVETDSNIDASFGDLALRVDDGEEIPADEVEGDQDVIFADGLEAILPQFIRGAEVTVLLRFWPTYPATGRHQATFTLIGFTKAYESYQACRGS